MEKGKCKTCYYHSVEEHRDLPPSYFCHRHPPAIGGLRVFTEADNWCGEYKKDKLAEIEPSYLSE